MSDEVKLTVIVGVQNAQSNLKLILNKLNPVRYTNVEFLFCTTSADPDTKSIISVSDNSKVIQCTDGRLIPEMWADGIRVAKGNIVALTTAHCIPSGSWVDTLLSLDMANNPGIGGVINNSIDSSGRDWAIYFLRYISYAAPQAKREINEIAADNAVYKKEDILEQSDLLQKGFWEPSFHARFRKDNKKLLLLPELIVEHKNNYSTMEFFKQRLAHGKEFGMERVTQISTIKRFLLIILTPVLPILFLKKIIFSVNKNRNYKRYLPKSFPWLVIFLFGWGLGEARGYLARKQS